MSWSGTKTTYLVKAWNDFQGSGGEEWWDPDADASTVESLYNSVKDTELFDGIEVKKFKDYYSKKSKIWKDNNAGPRRSASSSAAADTGDDAGDDAGGRGDGTTDATKEASPEAAFTLALAHLSAVYYSSSHDGSIDHFHVIVQALSNSILGDYTVELVPVQGGHEEQTDLQLKYALRGPMLDAAQLIMGVEGFNGVYDRIGGREL